MNDEIIKMPNGLWLIGGNYFHSDFCNNDEKIAKQYAKTLENCFGCVDCINCKNCDYCNLCVDCADCKGCIRCFQLKDSCDVVAPQLPPPLQLKMPFAEMGNNQIKPH